MMAVSDLNQVGMFQAILDRCPVGIAVIDYRGRFVTVNPSYCAIYGYTTAEMLDRGFTMLFPEEARAAVLRRHQHFLDHGGDLGGEWAVVRSDGTPLTVWSDSVPFSNADGSVHRLVYVLDITERKKTEQQMQIAASVYESSHEAILVTDAANRIIAANPAFSRLTGYSFADVEGQNPRIFKSSRHDASFYQAMWRALNTEGLWIGEIWDRHRDGCAYLKEMTITVVKDVSGQVLSYVAMFTDVTDRKMQQELIWRQAHYDALTGLPNRALFQDRLDQIRLQAERDGGFMSLMLLDLDHFKEVNDVLGHGAGDALLKAAAMRMKDCLRASDTIARLGGDEFAVILPDLDQVTDSARIARVLLEALARPFYIDGETIYISASIGIAIYPDDSDQLEGLFKCADQAMYAAKAAGRNALQVYRPHLAGKGMERLELESALYKAIERNELVLHYQPKVRVGSSTVVAVEALMRWRRDGVLVQPGEFIPLAEETGLIVPMSEWAISEVARQIGVWRDVCDVELSVAVNLPSRAFERSDLVDLVRTATERHGLAPRSLELEITETGLMKNLDRVIPDLHRLTQIGVEIAIDDFGTGYSSLAYLTQLPISELKIDRSFVRDLGATSQSAAVVTAVIALARSLGLKVVAEGVETPLQRDVLLRLGCDEMQGNLFACAMAPDELIRWQAGWALRSREHLT